MKWRHEPKRELMEEADEDMEQEIARSREEGGRRRSLAVHTPKSGRVCVCEMQSKCKAKAGRGRAGDGAGDWSRRLEQEIGEGDWSRRLEQEIGAGDWSRRRVGVGRKGLGGGWPVHALQRVDEYACAKCTWGGRALVTNTFHIHRYSYVPIQSHARADLRVQGGILCDEVALTCHGQCVRCGTKSA